MATSEIKHPLLPFVADDGAMEKLAQQYGTPVYVYDGEQLLSNLTHLDNALS